MIYCDRDTVITKVNMCVDLKEKWEQCLNETENIDDALEKFITESKEEYGED